jgi:AcrR family transcriptional regulator
MHTRGTDVKGKLDKRAQGQQTRTALITAAREVFGELGYGATSTEEIVALAGVTKGALYHHFSGKDDLFRAVYEQVELEVAERVAEVFMAPDPWDALVDGCVLWIEAHQDPAVRRIVLRDARAVLGWEVVRELDTRFGSVGLRGALRRAMTSGVVHRRPLRPLSLILLGALGEACLYVADAEGTREAREEVEELVTELLSGLKVPA